MSLLSRRDSIGTLFGLPYQRGLIKLTNKRAEKAYHTIWASAPSKVGLGAQQRLTKRSDRNGGDTKPKSSPLDLAPITALGIVI